MSSQGISLHEGCRDAGAGAYVPIKMVPDPVKYPNIVIDAVFVSPHKFIGGPGSSGVMVVRRSLFQ